MRARLPESAHQARPWRIHGIAYDFRLEDVWALPTPGSPLDFSRLVELVASLDVQRSSSVALRTLFAIRLTVGKLLGWDESSAGLGSRVPTLRERLPEDLFSGPSGPRSAELPFTPLYLTENEWALEAANETVHGVLHLGWVPHAEHGYRGQMAVLTKPNGRLGTGYMTAIAPFRHRIVYPALMRDIAREWKPLAEASHASA
jgi:hypothetical protein